MKTNKLLLYFIYILIFMNPLKLLENQLKSLERDLYKSKDTFDKGLITKETHELHIERISPKIIEYKEAINILKNK